MVPLWMWVLAFQVARSVLDSTFLLAVDMPIKVILLVLSWAILKKLKELAELGRGDLIAGGGASRGLKGRTTAELEEMVAACGDKVQRLSWELEAAWRNASDTQEIVIGLKKQLAEAEAREAAARNEALDLRQQLDDIKRQRIEEGSRTPAECPRTWLDFSSKATSDEAVKDASPLPPPPTSAVKSAAREGLCEATEAFASAQGLKYLLNSERSRDLQAVRSLLKPVGGGKASDANGGPPNAPDHNEMMAPVVKGKRDTSASVAETDLAPKSKEVLIPDARWGSLEKFYRKGPKLGEGGFGVVFKAFALVGDACFAAKALPKDTISDCTLAKQEYAALKALQGVPGVIKLVEALEDDKEINLVMELAKGGNLQALVDQCEETNGKSGMPEERALHYFTATADTLQQCHELNYLHLDIKPANVLLMEKFHWNGRWPEAKLADFGLSSFGLCERGGGGTLGFQAPEVLAEKPCTEAADIWALGALLSYLLTGKDPYQLKDGMLDSEVLDVVTVPLPFLTGPDWDGVSEYTRFAVQAMVHPDPAERPSIPEIMEYLFHKGIPGVPLPPFAAKAAAMKIEHLEAQPAAAPCTSPAPELADVDWLYEAALQDFATWGSSPGF